MIYDLTLIKKFKSKQDCKVTSTDYLYLTKKFAEKNQMNTIIRTGKGCGLCYIIIRR